MNRRIFLIIASSIAGLLAAGAYSARVQSLHSEIFQMEERVGVVTTRHQLSAGTPLQTSDLGIEPRLKNEISTRSVSGEELDLILGQRIFHPLPSGEVVLWTDLFEGPRLRKPSEEIPEGFRAMALPADEIHTMTHFISPGDDVDIVWTDFSQETSKIHSKVIAEKVRVLAVGQKLEEWSRPQLGEDYPMSVTLLVTNNTGITILEASQKGELHFLARGSDLFSRDPSKIIPQGK